VLAWAVQLGTVDALVDDLNTGTSSRKDVIAKVGPPCLTAAAAWGLGASLSAEAYRDDSPRLRLQVMGMHVVSPSSLLTAAGIPDGDTELGTRVAEEKLRVEKRDEDGRVEIKVRAAGGARGRAKRWACSLEHA
jgi:hypothetical protein